jgi:hypothetical protein
MLCSSFVFFVPEASGFFVSFVVQTGFEIKQAPDILTELT